MAWHSTKEGVSRRIAKLEDRINRNSSVHPDTEIPHYKHVSYVERAGDRVAKDKRVVSKWRERLDEVQKAEDEPEFAFRG